ncbi:hypothetical protein BJ742DRAFT_795361 [Cladochytrium replicatum]|nr:hypothetical protein BJ742DRAFT_795361 [Cladochytrium replicatum]
MSGARMLGDKERLLGVNEASPSRVYAKMVTSLMDSTSLDPESGSELNTLDVLLNTQLQMQTRLKNASQNLDAFNTFSATRYADNAEALERYTKYLKNMRQDLDDIFRRIRTLKSLCAQKYNTDYGEAVDEAGGELEIEDD